VGNGKTVPPEAFSFPFASSPPPPSNLANISWLLRTFGECQMLAQQIARRWLVSLLINKEFRVCHPLLARGNFASVNLNHQK
jgi:hypothetical protein